MRAKAIFALALGCAPLEGAEEDSGTTEAAADSGADPSSDATGVASTGGSSTGQAESTTGAGESSSGADTTGGEASGTTAGVETECTWTAQPNTNREWGVCGPARSWQQAEDYCVAEGGNLVSFAGATDNVFAINVLSGVMEAWIGLNDIDRAETYEWTDGTPYDYMNWDDTQPDSAEHRCVAIGVTQRWFDFDCEEARPFVCARSL